MAVPVGRSTAAEMEIHFPQTVVALMRELGKPICTLPDATGRLTRAPETRGWIFTDLKEHSIVLYNTGKIVGIAARIIGEDGVIRCANLYQSGGSWRLTTKKGDQEAESYPYETRKVSCCERLQRCGHERDSVFLERLFRGQVPEKDPWSILQINPCYIVSAMSWWDRTRTKQK